MKPAVNKVALVLFFICAASIHPQANVQISPVISLDVAGTHKVSGFGNSGSLSVNPSFTIGAEVLRPIGDKAVAGLGLMYLFPREQEVSGSGNFNFVTAYGSAVIDLFGQSEKLIPALVLNIGYNFIYSGDRNYTGGLSLKGGIYWGAGVRLGFNNLFIQGLYKSFAGSAEIGMVTGSSDSFDITYSAFSIGAGYAF